MYAGIKGKSEGQNDGAMKFLRRLIRNSNTKSKSRGN